MNAINAPRPPLIQILYLSNSFAHAAASQSSDRTTTTTRSAPRQATGSHPREEVEV